MEQKIVEKIIENGVKNLKSFGYPSVTKENILTDMIYGAFFKRMLDEAKGKGFDDEINHILSKITTELN